MLIEKKLNWMQTYSGTKYHFDPDSSNSYCIEDIAHALSLKCRFGGHCKFHYSVGQHSIHVAKMMPKEIAIHGLLHDAAEAYMPDFVSGSKDYYSYLQPTGGVGSPVMFAGNIVSIKDKEYWIMLRMYLALGLDTIWLDKYRDDIKLWDLRVLKTESMFLFNQRVEGWNVENIEPAPVKIIGTHPKAVEDFFLSLYHTYRKEATL